PLRDSIALLEHGPHRRRIEEAKRALEDGADPVVGGQHVDGALLHQIFEPVSEGRLAAPHGTQEVKDLLLFLESLRGMAEEADDALDRLLETIEVLERRVHLERAIYRCTPRTTPSPPLCG